MLNIYKINWLRAIDAYPLLDVKEPTIDDYKPQFTMRVSKSTSKKNELDLIGSDPSKEGIKVFLIH